MEETGGSFEYHVAYEAIQNAQEEIDEIKFLDAEKMLSAVLELYAEDAEFNLWRDMRSIRINELINGTKTWKPAKIVGFVDQSGLPEPLEIQDQEIGVVRLRITDLSGTPIHCLVIPSASLSSMLDKDQLGQRILSFLGTIVSVNTGKRKRQREFRFYIKQVSENVFADDLLTDRPGRFEWRKVKVVRSPSSPHDAPTTTEVQVPVDEPWIILHNILGGPDGKKPNPIISYIKEKVTKEFGIRGLDGAASQLGLAVEFCILQAFSQQRADYSYKLHSLIIGPPNVGKSFIPKIAAILNPVFDELPANSPKLTSAGLVARVQRSGNKSISVPGLLPRDSGGCVAMQDFHELTGPKRGELFGIFSKLMEDGEVIDRTSGDKVHEAVVALHLDTNRYSQVYPGRNYDSFSDLDIPINILSRFDFIMEIPKNAERQKDISQDLIHAAVLKAGSKPKGLEDWAKELRMITAYLRTRYDTVTISPEVGGYMNERLTQTIQPYLEIHSFVQSFEDMQNRVTRSVLKMVRAIACANMTNDATTQNVDYAMKFVNEKLNFIAGIAPAVAEPPVAGIDRPVATDEKARKSLLTSHFKGQEFTVKQAEDCLAEAMEGKVEDRTIRRDLVNIGAKLVRKGVWKLP